MPNIDPHRVPKEFFTAKTFFTVGGSAAAVWIFCLVLGAVFPQKTITPLAYRVIAIVLSEIIAIVMVLRLESRNLETWFISIFNGLLIFINASGWNVITANTFFSDKKNTDNSTPFNPSSGHMIQAGLFDSLHQVQWWQNNAVYEKNIELSKENVQLKTQIASVQHDSSSFRVNADLKSLTDSLLACQKNQNRYLEELKIRDQKIQALMLANSKNKKQNNTVFVPDTSFNSSERIKLVQSYRTMINNYENELKNCNRNTQELTSKIHILQHELSKYSGDPNSNQ